MSGINGVSPRRVRASLCQTRASAGVGDGGGDGRASMMASLVNSTPLDVATSVKNVYADLRLSSLSAQWTKLEIDRSASARTHFLNPANRPASLPACPRGQLFPGA